MSRAYISLGSNIQDRVGYINKACDMLGSSVGIKVLNISSLYETEPHGFKEQDWFINAVVYIDTELTPSELYKVCSAIEFKLGRDRSRQAHQWGPRTIDLDILFYDDIIIASDELQIPHARVHVRACILHPLKEITPDYVHPVIRKTVSEILDDLIAPEEVYIYGTSPAKQNSVINKK